MLKKIQRVTALSAVFLLLSGCFFRSPDDLYAVPKAPQDYTNLQMKIDAVISAGAEYAAPLTGNFTQTVQLRDLDGDGTQKAIAFFRVANQAGTANAANAGDTGKPLKIYIFRQNPDDTFEVQAVIEGDGTAVNSIAYEDLNGDGTKELIVSWQISNRVYELKVYSIHGSSVIELMGVSSYADFSILDIDKDNQKEIVVLYVNNVDSIHQADLYDYDKNQGQMTLRDSAPMSREIVSLSETKPKLAGFLKNYEPALFVTSNVSTGYLTDIFTWRDGHLSNITLNPETGMSEQTYRLTNNVGLRDINDDLIMELPRPMVFPDPRKTSGTDNFWSIQWVQYDADGQTWPVYTTYYNNDDGWYLVLPETWLGLISTDTKGEKITLSRRDVVSSGERAVVFSLWDGDETSDPAPFLTIYKLTGPNRTTRSKLGNRFILAEESDAIYVAEFASGGWDCGVTREDLAERFHFIQPDISFS